MSVQFQIIGGGLIGLSTAYALTERGITDIRIIEARGGVAQGTSFANAGMVHASLADPWNGPGVGRKILKSLFAPSPAMALKLSALPHLTGWGISFLRHSRPGPHWQATRHNYTLAAHSVKLIDQWRSDLSIQDDGDERGLLKIYRDMRDYDAAIGFCNRMGELGLRFTKLSTARAATLEPALSPIQDKLVGALYFPDDFKGDAYKFCMALEAELMNRGVSIESGVRIDRLLCDKGGVTGAVSGAKCYLADMTIIAAGARSAPLLETAGLKLPVRPVKGYSLTFKGISGPKLPVVDDDLHAAITPLGDRLRIAGTAQITGFNSDIKNKDLVPLLEMLKSVYPQLATGLVLKDATPWCGYRPVSADGLPFIGKTHLAGLAVNTGHGHMGWTFSAGSGDILADILHTSKTAIDSRVYSPRRTKH